MRALIVAAGLAAAAAAGPAAAQRAPAAAAACEAPAAAEVRTTLYFGLSRPRGGAVSELEWQIFLRDEVTPRFPAGLTVLDAHGQWRGADGVVGQEASKVLVVIHPDTPAARASVEAIVAAYRKAFDQEAVLWERAAVCVALE